MAGLGRGRPVRRNLAVACETLRRKAGRGVNRWRGNREPLSPGLRRGLRRGLELGLELLPGGALLGQMLRRGQRGLLRSAIRYLPRGQLSGKIAGALFLDFLFLSPLFLGSLFLSTLFLSTLCVSLRGQLGSLSRRQFGGLLCCLLGLQPCCLFRGPFRGLLCGPLGGFFSGLARRAFRLASSHLSGLLGLPRLLQTASLHDCQILIFCRALGLGLFLPVILLLGRRLLRTQASLLPRLRPRSRKISVFCSV